MTRDALFTALHAAGAVLRIEDDRLCCFAPRGAVPAALAAALRTEVPDIEHEYFERAGILEYDTRLQRPEAEALAAGIVLSKAKAGLLPQGEDISNKRGNE